MRNIKEELWLTKHGHVFMGSGHADNTRGVAIIAHKRWAKHVTKFCPINERTAYIDVKFRQFRLRLVSAYFPHSGYGDKHIQNMYDTLAAVQDEATKQRMYFIIGADFNARVGTITDDDHHNTIGQYGLDDMNTRGQWLKSWAATQRLTIANTFFKKQLDKRHTYTGPNKIQRQIDYFLVNKRFWKTTDDCESTQSIDLGSDHKAIRLRSTALRPTTTLPQKQKKATRAHTPCIWPPTDTEQYEISLTNKLDDLLTTTQLDVRCEQIEDAIKLTMQELHQQATRYESKHTANHKLSSLINQRRNTDNTHTTTRSQLSKAISKELRAIKRMTRRAEIDKILKEYKNLKRISGIKSNKAKELITSMTNADGQIEYGRQSITNVFATFYEQLYKDTDKASYTPAAHTRAIPPFTTTELHKSLRQLKTGKAADCSGIAAEMLKSGGDVLHQTLLSLYNAIILPEAPPPHTWQHTMIKVLHKSGDRTQPQNYRPIATIPMLYKLFARLLYNRLELPLDHQQSCDQAGFRRGRSTTDHLFTTAIIQETADEWQIPLWMAAVDFKKAFDSITHQALWTSLADQGIDSSYIHLLTKLYDNQTAAVKTDYTSRHFNIERGVKQGDPLSSLLFNCVSESLMRRLKTTWQCKRHGLKLQPHATERLTNLRFADDILLISTSLPSLSNMIADLCSEANKIGLQLHPDKTKILHNAHCTAKRRHIPNYTTINNLTVEILPTHSSTKYLGRKLSFTDPHRTEIENRIACAWKKFFTLKQELTGRRYSLSDRLRLFHGTVTPTVLYSCEAWTLTNELEQRLKRTRRQMLRMILHAPRRKIANEANDNTTRGYTQQPSTEALTNTATTTPTTTCETTPTTASLVDTQTLD